jgi:outer membrane lipase/esterase
MIPKLVAAFAGAVCAALPGPASALPFTNIYIFGDSLSDSGNVTAQYALLPHPNGAPAAIPGFPYFDGRFSNGPNYADLLAQMLGVSAVPSFEGGTNFAYGGARTAYDTLGPPFLGMLQQVNAYLGSVSAADPKALYVVFGGANNLQDILQGKGQNGGPPESIGASVQDLKTILDELRAKGARDFLVPNAPNLGVVPRITELERIKPGISALATLLSEQFDSDLAAMLNGETGLNIFRLDTFSLVDAIVADPARFGLLDVTHRCYTGDDLNFTGGGSVCPDPNSHLFWDGIHPTEAGHGLLALAAFAAVVPEPSTIVLLLIGLMVAALARNANPRRYTRRPDSIQPAAEP